jgi:hypothetical protein
MDEQKALRQIAAALKALEALEQALKTDNRQRCMRSYGKRGVNFSRLT